MKKFLKIAVVLIFVLCIGSTVFAVPDMEPCDEGGSCDTGVYLEDAGSDGCIYYYDVFIACIKCGREYDYWGTTAVASHSWNSSGFCNDCGSRLD